jgi:hypothetical protein
MEKQLENCYKKIKRLSFFVNEKILTDPDEEEEYIRRDNSIAEDIIHEEICQDKKNQPLSIYRQMRSGMARNASFLIPRINSRDS